MEFTKNQQLIDVMKQTYFTPSLLTHDDKQEGYTHAGKFMFEGKEYIAKLKPQKYLTGIRSHWNYPAYFDVFLAEKAQWYHRPVFRILKEDVFPSKPVFARIK